MKIFISGGGGFLGSNLAAETLHRKDELFILDDLRRVGSSKNLEWLKSQGPFRFFQQDIRNASETEKAIRESRPEVVFHLAGQVAMTTSIQNPRLDFEINVLGTLNVLEAVRSHAREALVIYSSTNKVYGDLEQLEYKETPTRYQFKDYSNGLDETIPLDFRSPYGCSKGAADQYVLDYARVYGLKTVVFRHSSIFGTHQFSTEDQGWVGWFIGEALKRKSGAAKGPVTFSGNGKQVRDILFSTDLVRLYFSVPSQIEKAKGHAFNIGGGMKNSLSLLELLAWLNRELKIELPFKTLPPRPSDQKVFVADLEKVTRLLGWTPQINKEEALRQMIQWLKTQ